MYVCLYVCMYVFMYVELKHSFMEVFDSDSSY
jgi:hypothetical protein